MNLFPAVMVSRKILVCSTIAIVLLAAFTPTRAAIDEKGQLFDGPGGKLYYEVIGSGDGTPLVLVNGGPGFDHTYLHTSPVWETMAKTRRIVFYDQRGNGRSAALKPGQSCTLADQIDDLEALRAHLGFDKMNLLGSSWGGFLAMAYSARHAERVERLVLVDSAAPKWSDTLFLFDQVFPETAEREAAGAFAREFGDKAAEDANIREYLSMIFYSPEHREAFLKQIGPGAFTKAVNEAVTRDLARFDLNPEIRKFRFPALVITGRYDMNVAPLVAYRIHKEIPGSRFAVFEKSSHLPFTEEPEAFGRTLEEFLASK